VYILCLSFVISSGKKYAQVNKNISFVFIFYCLAFVLTQNLLTHNLNQLVLVHHTLPAEGGVGTICHTHF
jgi:hypothetical protein